MLVNCRACAKFIRDLIGDGSGIGQCLAFNGVVAKDLGDQRENAALVALGNRPGYRLFWGGTGLRECNQFKATA